MSEPAATERFQMSVRVEPADVDELGHVNNVVYLRWVQEIAVAHWRSAATAEQQAAFVWVVVRHEIDYKRAALLEDGILLRTWVGVASRSTFERHTEILRANDQTLLARARTLWCPLDAKTMRVTPVGADVRARFSIGEA